MKCKAVQREIEDLEKEALLSARAAEHLNSCAACRVFRDEHAALRRLVGSLETVSAPANFEWRLRARLAASKSETGRRFRLAGFSPGAQSIALAASFALLVVAFVAYKQTRTTQTASNEQPRALSQTIDKIAATAKSEAESPSAAPAQDGTETDGASEITQLKLKESDQQRARGVRGTRANTARGEAGISSESPRIFSNDFGSRTAQDFVPAGLVNSFTDAGPMISVPVRSSQQPARVQFEDNLGAKRTLSLSPVTFGGQEVMDRRDGARLVPTNAQGIW